MKVFLCFFAVLFLFFATLTLKASYKTFPFDRIESISTYPQGVLVNSTSFDHSNEENLLSFLQEHLSSLHNLKALCLDLYVISNPPPLNLEGLTYL